MFLPRLRRGGGLMSTCCDTCPYSPECRDEEAFDCHIGLHDWMERGTEGDRWRECYLCGEVENLDVRTPPASEGGGNRG